MIGGVNYITPDEYQRWIGYASANTIRKAIKQGRLDAIKFNGRWLIPKNAILKTNRTGQCIGLAKQRIENKQKLIDLIKSSGIDPDDIL